MPLYLLLLVLLLQLISSQTCGNGSVETGEACDDGNNVANDGCTSCVIDTGYACTGSPSVCTKLCGNGVLDSGEACDDGNSTNADGCTNCIIDAGYACAGAPSVCTKLCGNGVLNAGETCDDGNIYDNDGCTNCAIDSGWSCSGTPSVCINLCGNGVIDGSEQCDSANSYLNGCLNCKIQSGYYCQGAPSSCGLLCGNGKRVNEDCDDGNWIDGDGCSHCIVERAFKCSGGSATASDTCVSLCPNSIIDQGEQCDDGNSIAGDGCYNCRVEIGWTCSTGACIKICGNGVIEGIEQCDDGNNTINDGCSNCKIDAGFICTTDSANKSTCTVVTVLCGDGYKSPSEQCDDGNTDDGDGCSQFCYVETHYTCKPGVYSWSQSTCGPTCGDSFVILPEECDDGNLQNGDGCDNQCKIEQVCGNAIRESREECDDGNAWISDGCSHCKKDIGYFCDVIVGGQTDVCVACSENCENCDSSGDCINCMYGYALYNKKCYSDCPLAFYQDQNLKCQNCPTNCLECASTYCSKCSLDTYLYESKCLSDCTDGYFEEWNAVLGNSCVQCFSPCTKCTSATSCQDCEDSYRLDSSLNCVACNMDSACIKCDENQCLECALGYLPNGQKCELIKDDCGDGWHSLSEQCDDANKSGGCKDCTIVSGFNCIVEHNRDVCYKLEALHASTYIDQVHFDALFVFFDRPLKQEYNFSNLIEIDQSEYKIDYKISQLQPQILSIQFDFQETMQNKYAFLNFTAPNSIVDKFGYSLVGLANESAASDVVPQIKAQLNYFIYYSEDERTFANTLSYIAIFFIVVCLVSSIVYNLKIGSGLVWQIIFSLQYISILRLVNMRYSLHIDYLLDTLNLLNLSFIPNIFKEQDQSSFPKFQINQYPQEFLANAGGRFILLMICLIAINLFIKLLMKFIHLEVINNILSEMDDYMKYQMYVRCFELIFLDLMISFVQSVQVYSDILKIISNVIAILLFICILITFALLIKHVLSKEDAVRIEWFHRYFNCLYDSLNLRLKIGRYFILVPYIQKLFYALIFITDNPIIQISLLCTFRIIYFPPLYKFNPYFTKILLIRSNVQAAIDVASVAIFLLYLNENDDKTTKVSNGWYIFMAILTNICQFTLWNFILLFLQFKAPDYLLEEFEADQKQLDDQLKESKKETVVKKNFHEEYNKNIKQNQIAPQGYVEPLKNNPNQIVPEGYVPPLKIPISQVAPQESEEQQQPKSNSNKSQVQEPLSKSQSQFMTKKKDDIDPSLTNKSKVIDSKSQIKSNRQMDSKIDSRQQLDSKSQIQQSSKRPDSAKSEESYKQKLKKQIEEKKKKAQPQQQEKQENKQVDEAEQLMKDFFG